MIEASRVGERDGVRFARPAREMGLLHPKAPPSHPMPLYKDGYRDGLAAIDAKGHVPVPRGPGLGVEIDWDWVSRNRTAVVEYKS